MNENFPSDQQRRDLESEAAQRQPYRKPELESLGITSTQGKTPAVGEATTTGTGS
jgi:hypothetical protein